MTTGKTIALSGWTFVGKVMSLLFNMLSPSIYNISKENPPPGNSLEGGRSQHVPEPASSGIVVPEGVDDPAQGP